MAGTRLGRRRVLTYGVVAGLGALGFAGDLPAAADGGPGGDPLGRAADAEAPGAVHATLDAAELPAFDAAAALGVLTRLLPEHAGAFQLKPVNGAADLDTFRVSGAGRLGRITVEGSSNVALLTGVNRYLRYSAGVDLSFPGDSLSHLPRTLPAPQPPIAGRSSVPHRLALNDTENGYAGAYRSWAAWERQIDLLAFHGYNEVLVTSGHDEVYRRTFAEFGYNPADLDAWIPGPAHQPWWLLGNISGLDGPVSRPAADAAVALTQKIVARLRELGMTPVLPGYYGTVPPGFAARNPGAPVVSQGTWTDIPRPDWLDPRDPVFARVAKAFYTHQQELYGMTTAYKMDLFHEGGSPGAVPLADAAVSVMTALQTHCPGATWMLLGWNTNPSRVLLDALRSCTALCAGGQILILDGCSDKYTGFDRETDWGGTPYAFGTIPNFGGRTLVGANAATWASRFAQAAAKRNSALSGLAWMPEASGRDPAAFELFAELGWRTDGFDLGGWFDGYAARRYGGSDVHATAAWRALSQTAYSMAPGEWSEAQDSLFCAWPDLSATAATPGGSAPPMRYDPALFRSAVGELLQVDERLRDSDAYRYDLVDITRQAMANHAREMLPALKAAYVARDRIGFANAAARWLRAMTLLDDLLVTDRRFLLGTWLADARSGFTDPATSAAAEYELRTIVTTWGGRDLAVGLHDYGGRELAGLVRDVYLPRWQRHIANLNEVLGGNPTLKLTDWFAMDDAWARRTDPYPTEPSGDPHEAASAVWDFITS